MRRLVVSALVLAATLLAGTSTTSAHPGHPVSVINVGLFQFNPDTLTIFTGDTIYWYWQGPDTNHSVTSDAGQAESFDSDPGKAPAAVSHKTSDYFSHIFNTEGRYTFHCKVHPNMRGTVIVQPAINLAPDFVPPLISALRAVPTHGCARRTRSCRHVVTHLRFLLSEDSEVSVLVERLRRGRRPAQVRSLDARGKQGPNDIAVSLRRLRAGRYRASLSALDAVGNLSSVRSVRFTVLAG